LNVAARVPGTLLGQPQQRRLEVHSDDLTAPLGRDQRGVARSGGDVDDALARQDCGGIYGGHCGRLEMAGHQRVFADTPRGFWAAHGDLLR